MTLRREQIIEVFDKHGPSVLAAAYRVSGNKEDAEDVLQSVFSRLLDGRIRLDGVDNPGAFLRVVATRSAIDQLRRFGKGRSEQLPDDGGLPDAGPSPRESAERRQLGDILRKALARIPEQQADVFFLRYVEGLSYEEIAHYLGLETGHIGVILHRGKARLRELVRSSISTEASR